MSETPSPVPSKQPPDAARFARAAQAPFIAIGAPFVAFATETGRLGLFGASVVAWTPRRPFRWAELARHMRDIGFGSLFIVVLAGLFTGLVFGLQTLGLARRFGADALVGPSTLITLARELGPVITGLMVAGRSGSGIATELGTMRVTEQIDALSTMAVEPIQYLVVPRVLAALIMVPMLASVFMGCGFFGSWLMAVQREGVDAGTFFFETWRALDPDDFAEGYIKAVFFGGLIALIGSYQGFNASGGARGVGRAATNAVVLSSVSILVGDYLVTELLGPVLHDYIEFTALPE